MFLFEKYYCEGQKIIDKESGLGEIWISGYDFAHNLE